MSDEHPDDLAERLATIDALPLAERASAFGALHDELTRALETSRPTEPS